jgi:hypothetical protein
LILILNRNETIIFFFVGVCPPTPCINGFCALAKCACYDGWGGISCDIQLIAPQIEGPNDTVIAESTNFTTPPIILLAGNPPPNYFFGFTPPALMTINNENGVISWPKALVGTYNVVIRAINEYASVSHSFVLTVQRSYECLAETTYIFISLAIIINFTISIEH